MVNFRFVTEWRLRAWPKTITIERVRSYRPQWHSQLDTISGFVEYIKSGQKQGDMLLVVPEGTHAVRLGNEASIKQRIQVVKGMLYSLRFSAARTCAQEEKLNVSVVPTNVRSDWGVFPIQTMYGSNGWLGLLCMWVPSRLP